MKPRLINRMGRWYCSDNFKEWELCGVVYKIIPNQMKGHDTPEKAYASWYDRTHKKTLWQKLRELFWWKSNDN